MRSRLRTTLLLTLLGATLAGACSHQSVEEEKRRRTLLTPPDTARARAEREEKARVFDDKGNLLESDQTVVGLVLPRGLSPATKFEHQWYFKAVHVPAEALEHFFEGRVQAAQVTRSIDGSLVVFDGVRPSGDEKSAPLSLQISKLKGATDTCELYIREPLPAARRLSASEAEAKLKAQRERAE